MMNVLLVEDEKELAQEVSVYLQGLRYDCTVAGSQREALHYLSQKPYAIIVLDLGLPDGSGFELLRAIKRDHPESFVLIASARGAVADRVLGLQDGADDYLPKPFALVELHARLQALWRRRYGNLQETISLGGFVIDLEQRCVRFQQQEIQLYKKEFDILSFLLLHRNRPLSRSQLYEHVWGDYSLPNGDSNYIDVHIKNIRKKLSVYATVDWLQSVRGIGYKIVLP
ncbi:MULTISPECIES: response regulator transcription factor [Sphingobacterium]|uniref:response regulator transcription factor n=1 Tax=Sphingobacterium TaxID=28453 RepID=UPI001F09CDCB|nr:MULTISPECIES: response regulator transcription factor [unclassified Sphingobacterium]